MNENNTNKPEHPDDEQRKRLIHDADSTLSGLHSLAEFAARKLRLEPPAGTGMNQENYPDHRRILNEVRRLIREKQVPSEVTENTPPLALNEENVNGTLENLLQMRRLQLETMKGEGITLSSLAYVGSFRIALSERDWDRQQAITRQGTVIVQEPHHREKLRIQTQVADAILNDNVLASMPPPGGQEDETATAEAIVDAVRPELLAAQNYQNNENIRRKKAVENAAKLRRQSQEEEIAGRVAGKTAAAASKVARWYGYVTAGAAGSGLAFWGLS